MKQLLIGIFFIGLGFQLFSQDADMPDAAVEQKTKTHLKFDMTFGTMFATTFGNGSYFGTYVSPRVSYPLSKKFTLRTGGMFTYSPSGNAFNPWYSLNELNNYRSPLTQSFLYAEGAYQLNENVILTGTVYKEIDFYNQPSPMMNRQAFDGSGVIMGIDYKLGENVFIHGQVGFSNRSNSYYSPFGFPSNPAYANPMFPSYMGW
ncbi:MAG: hypothetical protein K9G76_03035 [Bacteroidales bacterium]|nr:hypothetical protein [Bacteroidales bacterium]MCF8402769.1 hypothetical protein [Bacteroidales bacterium]